MSQRKTLRFLFDGVEVHLAFIQSKELTNGNNVRVKRWQEFSIWN